MVEKKLAGLPHTFNNQQLLELALQPRSDKGQLLEWLGDRVINLALAKLVIDAGTDRPLEQIVRAHSVICSNEKLCLLGEKLKLQGHNKPDANRKLLADGVEALIGAVYLDAGTRAVDKCVGQLFAAKLSEDASIWQRDPKTELKELCEKRKLGSPEYQVIKGKDQFQAKCTVDQLTGNGNGHNSLAAQKVAAAEVLKQIEAD